MKSVPWKVRASCSLLVLVAGGSLAGASRPAAPRTTSSLVELPPVAIRVRPPEPVVERRSPHAPEPGPPPVDVGAHSIPPGLTIDGATRRRMILFSFDDGPTRRNTPELLELLDELDIRAVFFVKTESFGRGNPWEREHREIVREIADRGHTIGNHTETHRQLPLLRNAEIDAELERSERKIENAIGLRPRLIRPPGGALSARVEALLASRGYTSVLWTVYTGDLEVGAADDVVKTFFRVLERRERESGIRGGIVLLHDTQRHSLEAVPRLVDALHRRNCELLERKEELYDIVDDLRYFVPSLAPPEPYEERQARLRAAARRRCAALAMR